LAPFWAGVEFNVVTDRIPLDRLVASDIQSRPGAIVALIVIVVVIFILVLNQLRVLRKAGLLIPYAKYYAVVGLVILIGSQLPGLIFRLHHYFAAIILMPLTAVPTRLSAIYQAFVLGIFLNGVAAFDFDAIFQTASEVNTVYIPYRNQAADYNCSLLGMVHSGRTGQFSLAMLPPGILR
jgi:hypothetical protein